MITQHGQAQAVVLDVETYEAMKDAMMMLRLLSESEAAVERGETVSADEAFRRMRRVARKK